MKISSLLIILLSLIIGISIIVAIELRKHGGGHVNPDGPSGPSKVTCPVTIDTSNLQKCNPSDPNSCNKCSEGLHSCFTVTDDNPYHVEQKITDSGEKNIDKVPNGNWCLPAKIKTFPCNEFSGYPVLTKLTQTEYAWRCQCKYPTLFTNKGEFGDCTQEVACGVQEDNNNYLKCPADSKVCTPGEKWVDNPVWEPTAGVCNCEDGTKFVNRPSSDNSDWEKLCVTDTCSPGGFTSDGKCICQDKTQDGDEYKSYVRCPEDVQTKNMCSSGPTCLPDPCNPGGYYSKQKHTCVCSGEFISKTNQSSIVGSTCYSPCSGKNNPCGKRGTCSITADGMAECKDCVSPYKQDKTNMCNAELKGDGNKCSSDSECVSGACSKQYGFFGKKICMN
jgi:hypothetical protein